MLYTWGKGSLATHWIWRRVDQSAIMNYWRLNGSLGSSVITVTRLSARRSKKGGSVPSESRGIASSPAVSLLCSGWYGRSVKLVTHLHTVLKVMKNGAIFPFCGVMLIRNQGSNFQLSPNTNPVARLCWSPYRVVQNKIKRHFLFTYFRRSCRSLLLGTHR